MDVTSGFGKPSTNRAHSLNIIGIEKEYQETQKKHLQKVIKERGNSTFYNPVLSMESRN